MSSRRPAHDPSFPISAPEPVAVIHAGSLQVMVYPSAEEMGRATALAISLLLCATVNTSDICISLHPLHCSFDPSTPRL